MFHGNDKMCLGLVKDKLVARIDPSKCLDALTKTGCREMDLTGWPMKGFVFIEPRGTRAGTCLKYWIQLALEYNPTAKSGKKTKNNPVFHILYSLFLSIVLVYLKNKFYTC